MISRKNRLIKNKDFARVHRSGKFFCLGNLSFKVWKNEFEYTRIGFCISLKFSKKAVERNRIKRQLREIFQTRMDDIKKGFDICVMAKKNKSGQLEKTSDLEKTVENILQKAKLLNN